MDLQDYATDRLGGRLQGHEVVCDCPNCGKDGHLYVNPNKGTFYCFVCEYGRGVRLSKLIQDLEGLPLPEAIYKAQQLMGGVARRAPGSLEELKAVFLKLGGLIRTGVVSSESIFGLSLPDEAVPLSSPYAGVGRDYLKRRGFTEAHLKPYTIYYGASSGRWQGHLIFPEYDALGRVIYFTSRAAYDGATVKSINPSVPKNGALLGAYALSESVRSVLLVEGPADMLSLSGGAVALMGKSASDEQIQTLRTGFDLVIIALDAGERKRAIRIALAVEDSTTEVRLAVPERGDPADSVTAVPSENVRRFFRMAKKLSNKDRLIGRIVG